MALEIALRADQPSFWGKVDDVPSTFSSLHIPRYISLSYLFFFFTNPFPSSFLLTSSIFSYLFSFYLSKLLTPLSPLPTLYTFSLLWVCAACVFVRLSL